MYFLLADENKKKVLIKKKIVCGSLGLITYLFPKCVGIGKKTEETKL